MKIIVFAVSLLLILFILGKMQENSFNNCIESGLQSEETCRFYSY